MRKILIITQRFYPDPGVGAVRMTQWARWLPKHGWIPIVACGNYGFPIDREEITDLIHPDAEIIYLNERAETGTPEKTSWKGRLRSVAIGMLGSEIVGARPQNPILRSAKDIATKFAATRGKAAETAFWQKTRDRIAELVRFHRPEIVITSAPPVALHDIGLHLKKEFPELLWVADFRDVYRQAGRYRVGLLQSYGSRKSLKNEAAIYRAADRIICTIPAHQRWIRKRFCENAHKTAVIFNGAPEELCERVRECGDSNQENFVKVVGFSEAGESVLLAKAVAEIRKTGESVKLKFVGKFPSVKPEIEGVLGGGVVFTGAVRHDQALEEIVSARVLVAVLSENRSRIPAIASKLFEYLAVPAPVVILNPSNAARTMFSKLPGVWMLTKPTPADIEAALQAALGTPADELNARAALIREKWSRRSQVMQLASMLDDLAEGRDMLPGPAQAASGR